MTQYNSLNVKLSIPQLNKYQQQKNVTDVTLKLSSNLIGHSNYKTNFSRKL